MDITRGGSSEHPLDTGAVARSKKDPLLCVVTQFSHVGCPVLMAAVIWLTITWVYSSSSLDVQKNQKTGLWQMRSATTRLSCSATALPSMIYMKPSNVWYSLISRKEEQLLDPNLVESKFGVRRIGLWLNCFPVALHMGCSRVGVVLYWPFKDAAFCKLCLGELTALKGIAW